MSARASILEKRDFDKFTTCFIYKSIQIIIQSRLGDKIKSKSKPFATSTDWFNLSVCDNNDVQAEAKKVLSGQPSPLAQNVCVEISLQTAEGDTMVLEIWYISLDSSQCDEESHVAQAGYTRMSIALKSLLSVSRVTPAYRLSRRQGSCANDYVICYRIYLGDAQFYILGDGYQKSKVGSVPTQVGTVTVNLAYRTKLLISPQNRARATPFEVKDDHFPPVQICHGCSGNLPKPCAQGYPGAQSEAGVGILAQGPCDNTFSVSPSDVYTGSTSYAPHHQSQPIKIVVNPWVENSPELESKAKSSPPDCDEKVERCTTNHYKLYLHVDLETGEQKLMDKQSPSSSPFEWVDDDGQVMWHRPDESDRDEKSKDPELQFEQVKFSVCPRCRSPVDSVYIGDPPMWFDVESDREEADDPELQPKQEEGRLEYLFRLEDSYPAGKNLLGRKLFGGAFAQQYRHQQEEAFESDEELPFEKLLRKKTEPINPHDEVDSSAKAAEADNKAADDKSAESGADKRPEAAGELGPGVGGVEAPPSGGAVGPIMKISEEDPDEFVMIDKVAAFGRCGPDDLGQFYRDLQNAPALFANEEPRNVKDVYDQLCTDLDRFELNIGDIDAFAKFVEDTEVDARFGPLPGES